MAWLSFGLGVCLFVAGLVPQWTSTLSRNITGRVAALVSGAVLVWLLDPSYLAFNGLAIAIGAAVGVCCLVVQVAVGRGVKLRTADFDSGMGKTAALIYLLELPAEEFVYRGLVLLGCLNLWGVWPVIAISSVLFVGLHLKTWRSPMVWVGSALLSIICSLLVVSTGSLWAAVLTHDLNDFGFLTLVRRRNIFPAHRSESGAR